MTALFMLNAGRLAHGIDQNCLYYRHVYLIRNITSTRRIHPNRIALFSYADSYRNTRWVKSCVRKMSYGTFGMREKVDFAHLKFDPARIKHLNLFGLYALKPFQYIMGKCMIDALGDMNASSKVAASKFVFYNDSGSGMSVGYLLPLLQVYTRSCNGNDAGSVRGIQGSTLIVTKDELSARDMGCLIISLNPNVDCLIIDDMDLGRSCAADGNAQDDTTPDADVGRLARQIATAKELTGSHATNRVLVASFNRIRTLLSSGSKGFSQERLKTISCIIFDDFSRYITHGDLLGKLYNRIKGARIIKKSEHANKGDRINKSAVNDRSYKGTHGSAPKDNDDRRCIASQLVDVHIIAIVDTIGDAFCKFAAEHLGGFWLYDFKNGTKQQLLGDGRTDAVRIEVDLDCTPEIINISHADAGVGSADAASVGTKLPIEHSICKVTGSNLKWARIYTLKCLVYHYLNLPTFPMEGMIPPMLSRPKPSHKCIIFVANRAQQRQLAAMECFREVAVYLGRDFSVYERAANLNKFRNGSRPIMIATDASIAGCNFDDVRYIFNYHPPTTVESYRVRAAIAGKNSNSLCITLYIKNEYPAFSQLLKDLGRRVSIHMPPSKDHMLQHNTSWLERFAIELVKSKPSFLAQFTQKAQHLLTTQDAGFVFNKCIAILLGDDSTRAAATTDSNTGSSIREGSILSGRRGYTAVTVLDGASDQTMTMTDLKRTLQRLLPHISVDTLIGRYSRTERGYVMDVATDRVDALLKAANDEPDLCFELTRQLPRMLLGVEARPKRARGHMSKLPWRRYKIRTMQHQKGGL